MKKIKLFGVLLIALTFGVVGVRALTVEEDLKLTEDLNEVIVVETGKTVTIDLNGHNITVTGASVDAISNHGTLTIKGAGKITAEGGAVVNYPEGTVTLENGEYFSTGWYTIKNMGTMTINNMKFANDVNTGASLVANGFYGSLATDRNQVANANSVARLTINGGTFENKNNSCNVIKNDDYGVLTINGGTFVARSDSEGNSNPVVQNWHKTTINDGTFTSINGVALTNGYYGAGSDVGEMTINGGTFTGQRGLFGTNGGAINGKGVLTIKGGTFYGDATLSNVYTTVIEGGIFDDNNVELPEDSLYGAFEILDGENIGEVVILSKDVLEDLELETFPYELDKDDLEEQIEQILETYNKYKNGQLEEELDEEEIAYLESAKKAIDELKKHTIVGYYDIYLAGVTEDGYAIQEYEESEKPMMITLELPEGLPKVKEGFTRKYYVVRIHGDENEVTIIDDVTVNDDGTISFKSDKFSLYALAYEDTEVKNADTYDNIINYIIIGLISTIMVFGISLYFKKRFN